MLDNFVPYVIITLSYHQIRIPTAQRSTSGETPQLSSDCEASTGHDHRLSRHRRWRSGPPPHSLALSTRGSRIPLGADLEEL